MSRLILSIESSCDETCAALVLREDKDCFVQILGECIYSQIDIHKIYGGVVPEIASRNHISAVDVVTEEALKQAGVCLSAVDAFAATYGPGLVGALLVGLNFAKGLAVATGKPFLPVNHIKGHIAANFIDSNLTPPFLCLVVSGGHTCLCEILSYFDIKILGETRDDAAGEAFDKGARALGLPYPGGVELERLSEGGDARYQSFPRAMLEKGSLDFSYSGLKSALIYYLDGLKRGCEALSEARLRDIAASYQQAIVDQLDKKTRLALELTGHKKLAASGGVASNGVLRAALSKLCEQNDTTLYIPKREYCTDNAAMIGAAAHFFIEGGGLGVNAEPGLAFGG